MKNTSGNSTFVTFTNQKHVKGQRICHYIEHGKGVLPVRYLEGAIRSFMDVEAMDLIQHHLDERILVFPIY